MPPRRVLGRVLFLVSLLLPGCAPPLPPHLADVSAADYGPTGAYVPRDVADACRALDRDLGWRLQWRMRAGRERDMDLYHVHLGAWMREAWGLHEGSRLATWFTSRGVSDPGDMTRLLLGSYWRHLNGHPLALDERLAEWRAYRAAHRPPLPPRCAGGVDARVETSSAGRPDGGYDVEFRARCGTDGPRWRFDADAGWVEER